MTEPPGEVTFEGEKKDREEEPGTTQEMNAIGNTSSADTEDQGTSTEETNTSESNTPSCSAEEGMASAEEQNKKWIDIFQKGGVDALVDYAKEHLDEWKLQSVNIAVVGESGAGKSSYINTLRGIYYEDEPGYAETGVTECTKERKCYEFPNNENIKMWDLPGAGTKRFKAAEYAKEMKFELYDAFVILSSERFSENDGLIANEIKKINKPFYFARTKMDSIMRDRKKKLKTGFNMKNIEDEIRNDCQAHLGKQSSREIYLIANVPDDDEDLLDLEYVPDNNKLTKKMLSDLEDLQRTAFVFSLTHSSHDLIDMKDKELKKRIIGWSATSGGLGAIPVPGVSIAVDLMILGGEDSFQREQLGIDDASLIKRAKKEGLNKKDILDQIASLKEKNEKSIAGKSKWGIFRENMFKTFYLPYIGQFFAKTVAFLSLLGLEMAVEEGLKSIPVIGAAIGAAMSGVSTYLVASKSLENNVEIAKLKIDVFKSLEKRVK